MSPIDNDLLSKKGSSYSLGTSKKESKIYKYINSPILIWSLTAVVITVGGAFYTNKQACVKSAQDKMQAFDDALSELQGREIYVSEAVGAARNVEELRLSLKNIENSKQQFKNHSSKGILHDAWLIAKDAGLKQSDPSSPEFADLPNFLPNLMPIEEYLILKQSDRLFREYEDLSQKYDGYYGNIYSGKLAEQVSDEDLLEIKKYARSHREARSPFSDVVLRENCSNTAIATAMFSGDAVKPLKIMTENGVKPANSSFMARKFADRKLRKIEAIKDKMDFVTFHLMHDAASTDKSLVEDYDRNWFVGPMIRFDHYGSRSYWASISIIMKDIALEMRSVDSH